MDDIGAFLQAFLDSFRHCDRLFLPLFIPAKVFLLSSTLTLYELLIGCHEFIYFSILTSERFSSYIMEAGLKIYHIQVVVNFV